MKDEIKEMLEQMESIAITGKDKNGIKVDGYGLQQNELKILLDYITNLQQEIKEANDSITWWTNRFKAVERDNRELKEENERLKEELFKSVNNTNNSMELTEDYKSRCEKAIEELKQAYTDIQNNDNANYIHIAFRNDLLNILQNGSEK